MDLKAGTDYLFDTTVFIDMLRGRDVGRSFVYQVRFKRLFVAYSIVTEAELWFGITGLRTEREHIQILRPYHRHFVNVTIARRAGEYRRDLYHIEHLSGKALPGLDDCLIAATAGYYGLTLVSSNTRHMDRFQRFGVDVSLYERQ